MRAIFETLTVTDKHTPSWVWTPQVWYKRFGETCCLQLQPSALKKEAQHSYKSLASTKIKSHPRKLHIMRIYLKQTGCDDWTGVSGLVIRSSTGLLWTRHCTSSSVRDVEFL